MTLDRLKALTKEFFDEALREGQDEHDQALVAPGASAVLPIGAEAAELKAPRLPVKAGLFASVAIHQSAADPAMQASPVTMHIKTESLAGAQPVMLLSPFKLADPHLNPAKNDEALLAADNLLSQSGREPRYLVCHASGRFTKASVTERFSSELVRLQPAADEVDTFLSVMHLLESIVNDPQHMELDVSDDSKRSRSLLTAAREDEARYVREFEARLAKKGCKSAPGKVIGWGEIETRYCANDWLKRSVSLDDRAAFVRKLLASACGFVVRSQKDKPQAETPYGAIWEAAYYLLQEFYVFQCMKQDDPKLRIFYPGHIPAFLQKDGAGQPLVYRVQTHPKGLARLKRTGPNSYGSSEPIMPQAPQVLVDQSTNPVNVTNLDQRKLPEEEFFNLVLSSLMEGCIVDFGGVVYYDASMETKEPQRYRGLEAWIEATQKGRGKHGVSFDDEGNKELKRMVKNFCARRSPPRTGSPALAAASSHHGRRMSGEGSFALLPQDASSQVAPPSRVAAFGYPEQQQPALSAYPGGVLAAAAAAGLSTPVIPHSPTARVNS